MMLEFNLVKATPSKETAVVAAVATTKPYLFEFAATVTLVVVVVSEGQYRVVELFKAIAIIKYYTIKLRSCQD